MPRHLVVRASFAYTNQAAASGTGRDHATLERPGRAGFHDGSRGAGTPAVTPA